MLGCVARGLEASGCVMHQMTLMTNHMHFIVVPPTVRALAVFVHRFGQRYAQLRNTQRGATGKLFEERFASKPISDEHHLCATMLYNDANAFRAGIVTEPLAHRWSTGPIHAGSGGQPMIASMWTPSPWYVALGDTHTARAHEYRELMRGYLGEEYSSCYGGDVYRRRMTRPNGSSAR